jgi:tripartite-type tricarboxylate transporter receptor subunit TctC
LFDLNFTTLETCMNFLKLALAISTLACLAQPAPAQAQAWPSKPLQMVVPQGAGGGPDALARLVGQVLGERLGQTVVIDNRAGAGGVLGVAAAAKAPADGYTLLIGSNTTLAANAFLYASFPVDPLKDFVPLALAADAPFVFVVPGASPVKSMGDLVRGGHPAPGHQKKTTGPT